MANRVTANLVKAQTMMNDMFNKGELRYRQPATFLEYVANSEIMIPSHKDVKGRDDRAVEVNYFARTARALGSARAFNHTGARGDSALLTPTWTTYADKFKFSLKQADTSVYSLEQEIANEYGNVIANFAEGLETAATAHLFANRATVGTSSPNATFSASQDSFEILEAKETTAIQIAKSTMDINKYQGIPYTFFCDSVSYDKFEYQANQGGANSANLSFQFSNIKFVKSLGLDALAAGLLVPVTKGFFIAVPNGMIASLDWIPKQNRNGVVTKENIYGTLLNPVDGLSYATHAYEERADEDASNGYTQDVKTEVEISVDISLEAAPSTTAGETPLRAFSII